MCLVPKRPADHKTCFEGECCCQPFLHECLLCCCYKDVVILRPCSWCNMLLGHPVYHHGTGDVATRKGTAAVNEIAVGLVLLIDSLPYFLYYTARASNFFSMGYLPGV